MTSSLPFDFDLLRSFVAVADNRSFTRAAARVGRTQSTVSLQIKKLEENLATSLFERGGRELQLTAEGEIMLTFARQLLQLADEARSRMLEPEVEGVVRLGTPEDFATVYLPDVLAKFARTHPRVTLEVNCNFSVNLLEGFSKGEYDIVLVKREPQGPTGGIAVWRDTLVWVGSPVFALQPGQPIPLVLAPAPDIYRKRALAALENVKRPWRIAFTSPSSEGLLAAVRAGLGVTILSKDMVPEGFVLMDTHHGLPILPDAEIALYQAPGSASRATQLLSEVIIHALEVSPTRHS
ncbi:MAG: LysR family transcriptional regulator [Rhizobiales bacterium]|nr:LysR family transcriptional regulator [Hyphomicrobiales bacterium]